MTATELETFVPKRMLEPIPGKATISSLVLDADLSYERWESLGRTLGNIGKANAWWIGDWIRYGEHTHGEMYSQGLEVTGLEYKTLKNYVWVAEAFSNQKTGEPEGRHDELSFFHHSLVAALTPGQREKWLTRAEQNNWTAAELNAQLKGGKGNNKSDLDKAISHLEKGRELIFTAADQDTALEAAQLVAKALVALGVEEYSQDIEGEAVEVGVNGEHIGDQ